MYKLLQILYITAKENCCSDKTISKHKNALRNHENTIHLVTLSNIFFMKYLTLAFLVSYKIDTEIA